MIDFGVHKARPGGEEGARRDFARMVAQLVDATCGPAREIRPSPGDWGIDVMAGDLNGVVRIWQVKYFLDGIAESQKDQIRQSFRTAIESAPKHGYTISEWVLCIPSNMSPTAGQWWDKWSKEAAQEHRVTISLWGETQLRNLLAQPEAAHVRREYYEAAGYAGDAPAWWRLTGRQALDAHWDPRGRGVERAARPGWFFTGRRTALSRLAGWLTAGPDPADNVQVVTGAPGSGKSAVLARLVTMTDPRYRAAMPAPLAADDPVAGLPAGCIDVAVHARTATVSDVVSVLASAAGAPGGDLDSLVNTLLRRRKPFTVVVDALDEAEDPPALARALRQLAGEAADAGVRLLAGTRPGGPDRRLLTALGLSARDDDPALLDLDSAAYLSVDDVTEYVRRRLLLDGVTPAAGGAGTPYRGREDLAAQVAAAVAKAAYPTFLIAQLTSRHLLLFPSPVSPGDPGWQQFPDTVAAAMDQYLALTSGPGQADQDRAEDLLRPLAYARGDGLPLDDTGLWAQLATALARPGRSYTSADIDTLLHTVADYLIETVITGGAYYYRFYHQALTDRLRERDQERSRPAAPAQAVCQCLLATVDRRLDGTRDWRAAHPYLHHQLAGHAADAGQLNGLLDDPGFLVAADPAGLYAALQRDGKPASGGSWTYSQAYSQLRPGPGSAGERASYLQLAARYHDDRLADQLGQLPLPKPWTARWAHGQRPYPHYIACRHEGMVEAVATAVRDGRPVIISADHVAVRVVDMETGNLVLNLPAGPDDRIRALAVGVRNGRTIIVGGGMATIRVWDLETGNLALAPLAVPDWVEALALAVRDGRTVIISLTGNRLGTARVWDLENGSLVLGPLTLSKKNAQTSVAVATGIRDGRPVIVACNGLGALTVWDLQTGEPVLGSTKAESRGFGIRALAIGLRDDRSVIVAGMSSGALMVWDLQTGAPVLGPLGGPGQPVSAVAMGVLDGRPVIASTDDFVAIRVWDLQTGDPVLGPLVSHDREVRALAMGTLNGRAVVISGSGDQTLRVWPLQAGGAFPNRPMYRGAVDGLALAERNGRKVVLVGNSGYTWSGKYSIGMFRRGTVQVVDPQTGALALAPLTGHDGVVEAVAAGMQQGRPVGTFCGNGKVGVWDLGTGDQTLCLSTSPDDLVQAVATGERRGRLVIIGGGSGATVEQMGDRSFIHGDGGGGRVRVWDAQTGDSVLGPLTGHDQAVKMLATGIRDSRPVIISCDYSTIRVWDLETGDPVLSPLDFQDNGVVAMAAGVRADHSVIVSGHADGTLWSRDLESGDPLPGPLTGHTGRVTAVALGQWGGHPVIVSGGADRTVRVWDSAQHEVMRIEFQRQVLSLACIDDQVIIGTTSDLTMIDLHRSG